MRRVHIGLCLFCVIFAFFSELSAQTSNPFWEKPVGVNFSGVELRDHLEQFAKIQKIGFFLDRRIDPGIMLDIDVRDVSGEDMFEQLAQKHGLGFCRIGSVAYLGPKEAAKQLDALRSLQEKQLEQTQPADALFWTQTVNLKTERLDSPKAILQKIAQKYRLRITNLDRFPHDLWPELNLLDISLNDLLLLLLIGFDATFEWNGDSDTSNVKVIKIVPVPKDLPVFLTKQEKSARNSSRATSRQPTIGSVADSRKPSTKTVPVTRKRFQMMKVQNKTLRDIMDYLSDQLALDVTIDEDSLRKKGIDPSQRISFELDNGNIHDVLRAALNPLNGAYQLNGRKLRVY